MMRTIKDLSLSQEKYKTSSTDVCAYLAEVEGAARVACASPSIALVHSLKGVVVLEEAHQYNK